MPAITINGITLPDTRGDETRMASLMTADSSETDYILIQTIAPLNKAQREELSELGVEILGVLVTYSICVSGM